MSKRKTPAPLGAAPSTNPSLSDANHETQVTQPSRNVKRCVSAIIMFQFGCLLVSLSSNLSPSLLQSRTLDWLGPYIVSTAQDYGEVPLEWTHGESIEHPMVVQVHRRGDAANTWESLPPPTVRISGERPVRWTSTRWTNLSRIIRLLYSDTGDNEILGEIVADTIRADKSRGKEDIDGGRLLSPVVINYQQYEEMMEVGGVTIAEAWPDSIVYTADVVWTESGELIVAPELPDARVSPNIASPRKVASTNVALTGREGAAE